MRGRVGLVVVFALLVVVPGGAVASRPEPLSGPPALPAGALADAMAKAQAVKPKRDSGEAKASRKASRGKFKGFSHGRALKAAREDAQGALGVPVWQPVHLAAKQKVSKWLSPYGALVTDESGAETKGLAVESSIPMTSDIGSGSLAPADVRLQAQGASIEAVNPLTQVRVATSADGWMSVGPSGLRFRLVGAAGRTNDVVDGRAFADNVLTDTDSVVAGDPRGLELSEVLRSPDAPEDFVYAFDLPDGARLVERADGTAVDVRRGAEVLAIVQAPSAWGADKAPIKTSVSVSGDRLTIHAAHRDEDVAYPAVVDPLVGDSFYWHSQDERSETGWSACGCAGMSYLGAYQLDFGRGMYIYSNNFSFFANNATGWGRYFAPGNTTITQARFDSMAITSTYGNMCAVLGLGKTEGGWETNSPWVGCGNIGPYYGNVQCVDGNNPCQNTGGHPYNIAWFETVASGDGNRDFENYMGQAQFTLRDDTPPSFSSDIPAGWTNGSSSTPIHVDASDDGFGLSSASLKREDNASWTGAATATGSCSHAPAAPTPCASTAPSATYPKAPPTSPPAPPTPAARQARAPTG